VAVTEAPFYHVGILVEDLDAAMARFAEALGVTFAPVMEGPVRLRSGDDETEFVMKATYSHQGPPHIELIQGREDGIFSLSAGERMHHLGCWSAEFGGDDPPFAGSCLAALCTVHPVPDAPPGMWLSDPAALHGVMMEFVDDGSRPMLAEWLAGRPPGV
jgi:hypothetical protein